ncbi:maleylpyruvate isomerase N-terminal domain-containing protein [Natronoglycomyces albus]|uniref:Mycothiol-dependent maleylpyruvate isomerase metal-binding domain-containing protein n=1 Tax=Natronoglycomyces albus TaxID=2811108 RepID=A0A895XIE6_9ACTN|nr:maleylpyruvate isomerase N-terminal domain-containing protein [Natronoglycomyces albus]QSB05581.1 hypothetical protein JQS30_01200 [Natronoglycomyces albus]
MTKPHVTDFLIELEHEAAVLRGSVAEADFNQVIPSRPDLTLVDLVATLVGTYRFIIQVLHNENTAAPIPSEPTTPRIAEDQLLQTFDDVLADLIGALKARPADSPAWNWAPVAKTVAFWHRRALTETALSRWDAQMAIGATEPFRPRLACDIIAEALEAYLPAGRRRNAGDQATHGLVQLFAQDADETFFVRLHARAEDEACGRISVLSNIDSDSQLQARAAGSASDLALALWGRLPFGITDAVGDDDLLQSLRVQ